MHTDRIWTLLARKLAGEVSPEEAGELESLLRENPDVHLKLQALVESWNDKAGLLFGEEDAAYDKVINNLKSEGYFASADEHDLLPGIEIHPRKSFSYRHLLTACLILTISLLGVFLWLNNNKKKNLEIIAATPINTISTKYGSRTKVELPDGSVVWLNAGSKLTYDKEFGNTLREVNLIGEGYFDVVHNAEKPFIIHTSFFDIKDLGTQFNVKCYPEDKTTETSLIEGSVEITVKKRPKDKWILKPDEKLVLLNETVDNIDKRKMQGLKAGHIVQEPLIAIKKLTYLAQDSFSVETAWTYNKLSFEDEAFSEVAKKMGRWFDAEFEFKNKKLEDIHLNGSFISETLGQAMEALKYTNRFSYEIKDRKVIIY
ncbi:MAG: FecR family protein [Bacteroidetes bacterium]|nr:FecR family protein [Bacteroidota bacterium]